MSVKGLTRVIIEQPVRKVVRVNCMAWEPDDVRLTVGEKYPGARVIAVDSGYHENESDEDFLERHYGG